MNQFGQSIRTADELLSSFSELTEVSKREHLQYLSDLIWQSKPIDSDIDTVAGDLQDYYYRKLGEGKYTMRFAINSFTGFAPLFAGVKSMTKIMFQPLFNP